MDKKILMKRLSFMIMGDGGVYKPKGDKTNCNFIMNMCSENIDYIQYVKKTLLEITGVNITNVPQRGNRTPLKRLESGRHPSLTKLWERIYYGKYKSLDAMYLPQLDWESLAILYMSDGGLYVDDPNKKKRLRHHSFSVSLYLKRLTYGDLFWLKTILKKNLNLEWNISRQSKYYFLHLSNSSLEHFMNGIRPYILKSFEYKILSRTIAPTVSRVKTQSEHA